MFLETYLAADIELYNYFKQKFDAQINNFGKERMEKEINILKEYNKQIMVRLSIIRSRKMSVCQKLKTSATTEPTGLYSIGNIPTGPVMVF